MKKVIFMLAVVLMSANCFAQTANVKKAKNAALAAENPDFAAARQYIEPALEDATTKDVADTWYVAGLIGYQENDYLNAQQMIGKTIDQEQKGKALIESYNYWLKADELGQIPNEKGKINTKIRKNIAAKMLEYYTQQDLVKYGIYLNEQRDFARAYEAFSLHLSIPDLPMMQDPKMQEKMPKDTIYQQYLFYKGIFAVQAEMHPEAIEVLEQMKDGSYEAVSVNQFLYQEYLTLNDTANFVRVLQEATERFPSESWFLQNLINYYIFSGQEDVAVEYLDKAIEREPNVAQYYHIKGNILENMKQYDAALQAFDAALAINPDLADAEAGKGRVYYNQAVKMNEDAANIANDKEYRAKLKEMDATFAKSLPFFEKAHELDPENRDYMIILKQLYYRANDDVKYNAISELLNQY
ncbi:MAG: tetratricopeptide repeat protein [Paludibacteraceae bacterium]